jgi:hypothetical protein
MNDVTIRFIEVYNYLLSVKATIGPKDFAEKIDVSTSMITEIIKGRSNVGVKAIQNTVKIFSVSPFFLFYGEGEMLSKENVHLNAYLNAYPDAYLSSQNCPPKTDGEKQYTPIRVAPSKTSSFAVPFYDIPVSAGPLGVLTYSDGAVKPDGYIDMEIFRRCDAILPVIGVSMEPEIHSGDLIGIRKLDSYNWEYIETGKVYMIVTTEDRMIKYINKADDSDYIICSSPNYHDFKIRKADILEIYRVIANIRAL